jgi:hypothetical protein
MLTKEGDIMESILTTQQLLEKFELLDPLQKNTVYEFMTFLLSKHQVADIHENKDCLLQTSVWTEQDVQPIYDVQQDINAWHIPTFS